MKKYFLLTLLIFLFSCSFQYKTADFIYNNAVFYTVNDQNPLAGSVAVKDGIIIFVGDRIPRDMMSDATKTVDLQGNFVLPGFTDSHVHFMDGGYSLNRINLRYADTKEDFINKIREYAEKLPKGAWILGGNWDHTLWQGQPLPERWWIDEVTKEHPVFINRLDGHMALANTLAMRIASVDNDIESPPGGVIVRDNKNRLTGIFKESAKNIISKHIPENENDMDKMAAIAAVKHCLSEGVTSVHDMGQWRHLTIYDSLLSENKLKVRITLYPPISQIDIINKMKIKNNNRGFLKVNGFKGFIDGSLGSSTAKFFKPYLNDPENKGVWDEQMIPPHKMYNRIKKADSLGYQVVVHAIGTEANHKLLEMFKDILDNRKSRKKQRFRIEHAQHLIPEDIEKFAAYGVIPSMQPYHCIDDGRWAETIIDYERCQTTYAFGDLLEGGARVAFGSDWDVAPISPLWGIYAAVTRRTLDDKNPDGWIPGQKISVEEAIRCYTINAAYADFSEKVKGSIEKDKYADFVVLSDNLLEIDPVKIKDVEVEKTIVAGEILYSKN